MIKKLNKNKGITLITLVITIIILLILAGITINALTKENGLFVRAKEAKEKQIIGQAKEQLEMKIAEAQIEKEGNAKLIDIAEVLKNDKDATYTISLTKTSDINGSIPDLTDTTEMYVTHRKKEFKIDQYLKVTYVGEGISTDGNPSGGDTSGGDSLGDINAKVTITKVNGKSFIINVDVGENADNILLYQYFVNGNKIYEGTETQYKVSGLDLSTNYKVSVNVVPKTSVNVATLEQRTNDTIIIEMANNFDKYIYIDSNNGNDKTGNGSISNPYATLDKIADNGIIENGYNYAIILKDGQYSLTNKIITLTTNSNINIIGNRQNTKLYSNLNCGTSIGIGNPNYKINFYRLVIEDNTNMAYEFFFQSPVSFYNVVFNYTNTPEYGYILPSNGQNEILNCTIINGEKLISVQYSATMKLTNCYGKVTSGYGTNDSTWNYQTNYIISTPQIETTTYRITDNESIWEHVGTGLNPDETQANLGVYGGRYSWEYETDID